MKQLSITIFILLLTSNLFAQQVKIDAQIRTRSELEQNKGEFNTVSFNNSLSANSFSLFRSRIGFTFIGASDNVTGYLQFQDSRTFGEETSTKDASADALDLHQGYIKYYVDQNKKFFLQAGRMELSFGNSRFVGRGEWGNTGQAFDGLLLKVTEKQFDVSCFTMTIAERTPFTNFDPDEYFSGGYVSYRNAKNRNINGFIFNNVNYDKLLSGPDKNQKKLNRTTIGFHYIDNIHQFDYELESAYQFGRSVINPASYLSPRNEISAYLIGLRAKYSFPAIEEKPSVNVGLDILSGDPNRADKKIQAINTLYPSAEKFYGIMNYFTKFPATTANLGLIDIIGGFGFSHKLKPSSKSKNYELKITWYYFMTDKEDAAHKSYLGNELDIGDAYTYENINFQYGVSIFFPGDIPKETPNNKKLGKWAYVMLTYNFKN